MENIYVVTGITGQVGSAVARTLLAAHLPVRGVVRDAAKAAAWAQQGCEIAIAEMSDAVALAKAFQGTQGVFILPPPCFDPAPDFDEARALAATLKTALESARPGRVVYLSTIGAQSDRPNLLSQHSIVEAVLRTVDLPITFLRPAWFMENCAWDVAPAMATGMIPSFLQPLDRPFPMVATADIGRVAAELLQERWTGRRNVELEGPERVTPLQIAAKFAQALGRPVQVEIVPRGRWKDRFKAEGMKNPQPRIAMLDGFNEGWIEFEARQSGARKGEVFIGAVIEGLVKRKRSTSH
jgi:uncharacterized protein YbjT (DUF2867 family)